MTQTASCSPSLLLVPAARAISHFHGTTSLAIPLTITLTAQMLILRGANTHALLCSRNATLCQLMALATSRSREASGRGRKWCSVVSMFRRSRRRAEARSSKASSRFVLSTRDRGRIYGRVVKQGHRIPRKKSAGLRPWDGAARTAHLQPMLRWRSVQAFSRSVRVRSV